MELYVDLWGLQVITTRGSEQDGPNSVLSQEKLLFDPIQAPALCGWFPFSPVRGFWASCISVSWTGGSLTGPQVAGVHLSGALCAKRTEVLTGADSPCSVIPVHVVTSEQLSSPLSHKAPWLALRVLSSAILTHIHISPLLTSFGCRVVLWPP